MNTTYEIAQTLDLKGLPCPIPVVRVGKAIKSIDVGQILEALATDPGVMMDIPAWCKSTGHEIVELIRNDGVFRFVLRRVH
jgi:tRNA 2-thiouridine synthesizing protein A